MADSQQDLIEQLRQDSPRDTVDLSCRCYAPDAAIGEWDNIPENIRPIFDTESLPCDGEGNTGPWCEECIWGEVKVME
jgi:hypothetical protein